jgi:hypothetical protein
MSHETLTILIGWGGIPLLTLLVWAADKVIRR